MILAGADDGCVGAELFRHHTLAANPACRVDLVDGAGHFLHLERPRRVEAAILEHLAT
jgi:pimeloyl-ACP methyl ester carboxylesterase